LYVLYHKVDRFSHLFKILFYIACFFGIINIGVDYIMKQLQSIELKQALIGISVFFGYLLINIFGSVILYALTGINTSVFPLWGKILYMFIINILMIVALYYVFKDVLISNFKDLKKNHKEYFNKYFKVWLAMLGLILISNVIISYLTGDLTSDNQASLNT